MNFIKIRPSQLMQWLLFCFEHNFVAMVWGPPGIGKCLKTGTSILMYDGTVRAVEDVQVGDRLLGPDGGPRNVLSTVNGRGKLYEVRPKKGDSWYCNEEHILTVSRSPQWKGDPWAGALRDIHIQDFLNIPSKFRHHLKQARASVDFGVSHQHAYEENWNSKGMPLPSYMLGALLGDGSLQGSVRFTSADEEIVKALEEDAEIVGATLSKNAAKYEYGISTPPGKANPVLDAVKELGLWNHGSEDKFIPHEYKIAPEEERLELLAGLLDTDGHLQHSTFEYVSKSPLLAIDTAFVARSLGFRVTSRDKMVNGTLYRRLHISGDVHRIPCRLPRKKAPVSSGRTDPLRTGFSVHDAGEGTWHGFTLDGDQRFLLSDFTITHNSAIVVQATERWLGEPIVHGENYRDFRANLKEPVDVGGLPNVINGVTHYNPPSFWPRSGRGVLNIEEAPNSQRDMQSALYPITFYPHRIDDYQFPEDWRIVLTGNRMQDGGGTFEMPVPLKNRLLHFELQANIDDFLAYAVSMGFHPGVVGYLRFKNMMLHKVDHKENAFPTPRTWEMASRILIATNGKAPVELLQSAIGTGAAHEVIEYLEKTESVPSWQEILDDPECILPFLKNLGMCHAIIANVLHAMAEVICPDGQRVDDIDGPATKLLETGLEIVKQMPSEFQMFYVKGLGRLHDMAIEVPGYMDWAVENKSFFSVST